MAADRTKFREAVWGLAEQGGLTIPQIKRHARAAITEGRKAISAGRYADAGNEFDFAVKLIRIIAS